MASIQENKQVDVVVLELPAPPGWIKKFTPRKGGTPRRNDIVFVAPTGEEIRHKRQLEQYLKSHIDGPALSEFDWGLGCPRRSARLNEKLKAEEGPESESPKKKQRKSSVKKQAKDKNNNAKVEDEGIDNKNVAAEEATESVGISMTCAEDAGNTEVIADEALPPKADIDTKEEKTVVENVLEEAPDLDVTKNTASVSANAIVEESKKADIDTKEEKTEGEDVLEEAPDLDVTKNTASESADAIVEESKNATTEVIGVKTEQSKELADVNCDESKDAYHAEKGTADEKVDDPENIDVDQNNSDEKQASEIPGSTDMKPALGN